MDNSGGLAADKDMTMRADVIVVGAGTVGAAIAYGLALRGLKVIVLDGADTDNRAAVANFGLIWLQGKGLRMPQYQTLSRESVRLWPAFHDGLADVAGGCLDYEHHGGLTFCLGEAAFDKRRQDLLGLHDALGGAADWEMLDRKSLQKMLPKIILGPDVAGASFGHRDGQINPLKLLARLLEAVRRLGGVVHPATPVDMVAARNGAFTARSGDESFHADRIVICAGLGSTALARQLGVEAPLRPQRGQIQVTERVAPILPLPTVNLRQTAEGTLMIGTTYEDAGLDGATTSEAAGHLAERVLQVAPGLKDVRLVRQWAGLRVMTPDSYPIYAQSAIHPGAFVALCHSGITLAPLHADLVAAAVADGRLPASLAPFHTERFHVPHAA